MHTQEVDLVLVSQPFRDALSQSVQPSHTERIFLTFHPTWYQQFLYILSHRKLFRKMSLFQQNILVGKA